MEKCQAKAAENKTRRKEHRVRVKEQTEQCQQLHLRLQVQCNLDLVTLNLVTTCDLVTILKRLFFNLLHKIIRFSNIMQFSDSFCGDQKSY